MSKCMLILAGTLLGGAAVAADSAPLAQCAAVDDPAARLACYDALAGRSAPAAPDGTAPAVPGAPPVTPAAPAGAAGFETFGKDRDQGKTLTARIVGRLTHWKFGTEFKLDNGQVWKSVDDRALIYPDMPEDAEVEIWKGMFGYRMDIKPIGRRIAVKRVS